MTTPTDRIPAARSRKALWLGLGLGAAVITLVSAILVILTDNLPQLLKFRHLSN